MRQDLNTSTECCGVMASETPSRAKFCCTLLQWTIHESPFNPPWPGLEDRTSGRLSIVKVAEQLAEVRVLGLMGHHQT